MIKRKYNDCEKHPVRITLPISKKMHRQLIELEQKLVDTGVKKPSKIKVNWVIRSILDESLNR